METPRTLIVITTTIVAADPENGELHLDRTNTPDEDRSGDESTVYIFYVRLRLSFENYFNPPPFVMLYICQSSRRFQKSKE